MGRVGFEPTTYGLLTTSTFAAISMVEEYSIHVLFVVWTMPSSFRLNDGWDVAPLVSTPSASDDALVLKSKHQDE